jgi:hypothetical protein
MFWGLHSKQQLKNDPKLSSYSGTPFSAHAAHSSWSLSARAAYRRHFLEETTWRLVD